MDLSSIKLGDTVYSLKDTSARQQIATAQTDISNRYTKAEVDDKLSGKAEAFEDISISQYVSTYVDSSKTRIELELSSTGKLHIYGYITFKTGMSNHVNSIQLSTPLDYGLYNDTPIYAFGKTDLGLFLHSGQYINAYNSTGKSLSADTTLYIDSTIIAAKQ